MVEIKKKLTSAQIQALGFVGCDRCPTEDYEDYYDQDILTKRECPKCGERIVIQPDCVEYCSNDRCDYKDR